MTATNPPLIRMGLQIPNFTYPGVADADLFETVATVATTAERAGADSVFVMDHFFQLAMLGSPDRNMFEAYTLLGALGARTSTVRLGTLVTGVTYRQPAVLAKQVTTLDVITRGRALLGIGAAWFDLEHHALGVDFPPLRERFERLEDAIRICRAMFTEDQSSVTGTHYRTDGAWNHPAPIRPGGPPIMLGGHSPKAIERAARLADAWISGSGGVDMFKGGAAAYRAAGGRGKLVALTYFALGAHADELADRYLSDYYGFAPPYAQMVLRGSAIGADRLRETLSRLAEAGCDEVLLAPCGNGLDQLKELREFLDE